MLGMLIKQSVSLILLLINLSAKADLIIVNKIIEAFCNRFKVIIDVFILT